MDGKLSVVLGLMVTGFFPALSLSMCAWQTGPIGVYTEDDAVAVALNYLRNCPTFRFDGIPDSVRVVGVEMLRSPWTWEVSIAFECRHAGYGDRTGKILAQVISPHQIRVVVQRGDIVSAIIDEVWDELAQKLIT